MGKNSWGNVQREDLVQFEKIKRILRKILKIFEEDQPGRKLGILGFEEVKSFRKIYIYSG